MLVPYVTHLTHHGMSSPYRPYYRGRPSIADVFSLYCDIFVFPGQFLQPICAYLDFVREGLLLTGRVTRSQSWELSALYRAFQFFGPAIVRGPGFNDWEFLFLYDCYRNDIFTLPGRKALFTVPFPAIFEVAVVHPALLPWELRWRHEAPSAGFFDTTDTFSLPHDLERTHHFEQIGPARAFWVAFRPRLSRPSVSKPPRRVWSRSRAAWFCARRGVELSLLYAFVIQVVQAHQVSTVSHHATESIHPHRALF